MNIRIVIDSTCDLPAANVWAVAMMTLGFFAGSLYVFIALQASGDNWRKFWLGKDA